MTSKNLGGLFASIPSSFMGRLGRECFLINSHEVNSFVEMLKISLGTAANSLPFVMVANRIGWDPVFPQTGAAHIHL